MIKVRLPQLRRILDVVIPKSNMMNKNLCTLTLFLIILFSKIQAQKTESGLLAPENWRSEILSFPLGFAPEIDLVGFEDVLFAPGWNKKESEQFWMYHFTWFLDTKKPMTVDFLEKSMKSYYEGLAKVVLDGDTESTLSEDEIEAICLFVKTENGFDGRLKVFDPFFTKAPILLNMKVKTSFCVKTNQQIVAFDISPKSTEDPVWKLFKNIKLRVPCN